MQIKIKPGFGVATISLSTSSAEINGNPIPGCSSGHHIVLFAMN